MKKAIILMDKLLILLVNSNPITKVLIHFKKINHMKFKGLENISHHKNIFYKLMTKKI